MISESRPSISICNIVKNEEKQVKDFLASLVDFADEIIMVDTGSSDNTFNIINDFASQHSNVKLYEYWSDGVFHYGKAKNFSLKKATKDFIIILDTDERLSPAFKEKVRLFLSENSNKVFRISRIDEVVPHLKDSLERIVKNHHNIFYNEDSHNMVHENLDYDGDVGVFDEVVWHQQRWNHYIYRPQRILFQLELQIERTPKTKSFFGHLMRGFWYFDFRFRKLYFKRSLYKDGKRGFKYAFMRSVDAFLVQFFVGLKADKNDKYWENKK